MGPIQHSAWLTAYSRGPGGRQADRKGLGKELGIIGTVLGWSDWGRNTGDWPATPPPQKPLAPRQTPSHICVHLSALNDLKKKLYRNHHSLIIFCLQSPASASRLPSRLQLQRNLLSSHTYRFPAGTLRKNRLFPRLMLPWKGEDDHRRVSQGCPKPRCVPPQTLQGSHPVLLHGWVASRCCPAPATYLPVQLAPAVQPGGVGGCVGEETPGQPREGKGRPARNYFHPGLSQ